MVCLKEDHKWRVEDVAVLLEEEEEWRKRRSRCGGLEMKDGCWMVDDDGGAGNVMVMGIHTQRCCVS